MRLVEAKITYDHLVPGGFGWSDCIQLVGNELQVHDLKYGRGEVSPVDNESLLLYASGAYQKYSLFYDIQSIVLVIHQPRLGYAAKEHRISIDELMSFDRRARAANARARAKNITLTPGEKQCQWCKAKAVCRPHAQWVGDKIAVQFDDITDFDNLRDTQTLQAAEISDIYKSIPMIEGWCKALSNQAYKMGLAGNMPDHKIVAGKQGNRRWVDEDGVLRILKKMRVRKGDYITEKFTNPTQLEKKLTKRQFEQVADQVSRSAGKPVLVRITDKRPAIQTAGDFENMEGKAINE